MRAFSEDEDNQIATALASNEGEQRSLTNAKRHEVTYSPYASGSRTPWDEEQEATLLPLKNKQIYLRYSHHEILNSFSIVIILASTLLGLCERV